MDSNADPATVRYLEQLAVVLCPVPRFSSTPAHSLASRRSRLDANELSTKCNACRTEVVGGVNGSYWTERGRLWLHCERCHWTTLRASAPGDSEQGKGKDKFQSVKKRRREQARRANDAVSHPTQFRSAALPSSIDSVSKRQRVNDDVKIDTVTNPAVPLARPRPNSKDSIRPLLGPSSVDPSPGSSRSTFEFIPNIATLPTVAPPSLEPTPDSKLAAAPKKRKRSKQPTGLAELLAKKKKEDEDASHPASRGGASGKGSLGLQDFLQGLS